MRNFGIFGMHVHCIGTDNVRESGLSLRTESWGFPRATKNVAPGYFHRKIEPKEIRSCLILHLLDIFTQQLEILVTTLMNYLTLMNKVYSQPLLSQTPVVLVVLGPLLTTVHKKLHFGPVYRRGAIPFSLARLLHWVGSAHTLFSHKIVLLFI